MPPTPHDPHAASDTGEQHTVAAAAPDTAADRARGWSRAGEEVVPAFDLSRYWRVVRKRVWVIAAVLAVGVTATVLYTRAQPKIYQASASVVIDPNAPQVFGNQVQEVIQLGAQSYWSTQEYYNTQLQIMVRHDLVARTLARLPDAEALIDELVPTDERHPLTPEQRDAEAVAALSGYLSASQARESRVVSLHAQFTDPERARQIANLHVETFLDYHRNLRGENTEQITDFLDQELVTAARDLEASERALLSFKRENDILSVSLQDRQSILAADIARFNAALSDARIQRIELGTLRGRAQAVRDTEVMESPVFALSSSSDMVEALKEQYIREKHRLAELSQELGPRHPEYQSQEVKTQQQYQAILAEARRALGELDERYQAALARERALGAEVERLKAEAFELGDKAAAYKQLEREQESDEERYKLVLSRLSASRLSQRNTASNVHLHSLAREATLVYPRLVINLAVAVALSLMLGLGLAFVLDLLDRTIKSPAQVEEATGAALLGVIPAVEVAAGVGDAARARDLYVVDHPASAVAEHCRSIRTNILFSSAARPMKILTISSPRQGEGKTTTTLYMGAIMAQSGQRVLVVDTDMRRPRLHRSLGASARRGLSDLLLPDVPLERRLDQVLVETEIPGLTLLPCGPLPPNPAELLLTERFRAVLALLGERFDRVLLDSPPLMLMNDAVVLSRLSDGVVMVVQAGTTAIDDVARSARMVRDVSAPVLGVILNNLSGAELSGGYGNYYRDSYGYGSDGGGGDGGGGAGTDGGSASDREAQVGQPDDKDRSRSGQPGRGRGSKSSGRDKSEQAA
ncbi:MAG: exopolysaccharide regulatory tyrosine autokinase VpsO [Haliangiales bacterium]